MKGRYEALLNGVPLSDINPKILILDINYPSHSFNDNSYSVAKRNGIRSDVRAFDPLTVTISFEIHEYDTRIRQDICNAVCLWAKNGGVLDVSDRVGQFLRCVCSQFPSVASVRNWTDPLTIAFTANCIPFWQERIASAISLTAGTSGSGELFVPGSVNGALVEANIHTNELLSSVALTVNGRTLALSGLAVASGRDIKITYDNQAIQSIKVDSTSLLPYRSGVDDLLANCGENNTVSFTSSASAKVTFSARGLWL